MFVVNPPKRVAMAKPMKVNGASNDATFWAQFVGATPGGRSVAFAELCARGGNDIQVQEINANVRIEVDRGALSCHLVVGTFAPDNAQVPPLTRTEQATVAALDRIVTNWGPPDTKDVETAWVDTAVARHSSDAR